MTDELPMSVRLTGGSPEIEFYESACEVTKVTNITNTDAVILDLACAGEGMEWSRRMVLMANDRSTMSAWTSDLGETFGGSTEEWVRCRD